jgi:hypothetical protein
MDVTFMIRAKLCTVALIVLGFTPSAYAQAEQNCSDAVVNTVGKHFDISNFSYLKDSTSPNIGNGGVIIAGACKVSPIDKSITIAAFAYDEDIEDGKPLDDDIEGEKPLVVALVDTQKGQVISAYTDSINEDATMRVADYSLSIDTARYVLAPGVRAFGINIVSGSHPHYCTNGDEGGNRALFVQDGKTLKPILERLTMSYWTYLKGGDSRCMSDTDPAIALDPIIESFNLNIGIGKATTNGYANLLITVISSYDNGTESKRRPFHYELRYDGETYPTDEMLNALYAWQK